MEGAMMQSASALTGSSAGVFAGIAAAGAHAVVGGVDVAAAALRQLAELVGGAGDAVGMVLGHQPAVGALDVLVAGVVGDAEDAVVLFRGGRRRAPGARAEPAGIDGVPEGRTQDGAGRVPHQHPAEDGADQLPVPPHAGRSCSVDCDCTARRWCGPAWRGRPWPLPCPAWSQTASPYNCPDRPGARRVPTTLHTSDLPLPLLHRGKVRDVYALPGNELLIVASDRLSAFDVVLPDPIPGKGEILTQLSNFWFARTAALV